jgi:hypothetical protein
MAKRAAGTAFPLLVPLPSPDGTPPPRHPAVHCPTISYSALLSHPACGLTTDPPPAWWCPALPTHPPKRAPHRGSMLQRWPQTVAQHNATPPTPPLRLYPHPLMNSTGMHTLAGPARHCLARTRTPTRTRMAKTMKPTVRVAHSRKPLPSSDPHKRGRASEGVGGADMGVRSKPSRNPTPCPKDSPEDAEVGGAAAYGCANQKR